MQELALLKEGKRKVAACFLAQGTTASHQYTMRSNQKASIVGKNERNSDQAEESERQEVKTSGVCCQHPIYAFSCPLSQSFYCSQIPLRAQLFKRGAGLLQQRRRVIAIGLEQRLCPGHLGASGFIRIASAQ